MLQPARRLQPEKSLHNHFAYLVLEKSQILLCWPIHASLRWLQQAHQFQLEKHLTDTAMITLPPNPLTAWDIKQIT